MELEAEVKHLKKSLAEVSAKLLAALLPKPVPNNTVSEKPSAVPKISGTTPVPKKPRGRPRTTAPISEAERKRRYREKLKQRTYVKGME
jgi:hypothetical protein